MTADIALIYDTLYRAVTTVTALYVLEKADLLFPKLFNSLRYFRLVKLEIASR